MAMSTGLTSGVSRRALWDVCEHGHVQVLVQVLEECGRRCARVGVSVKSGVSAEGGRDLEGGRLVCAFRPLLYY